MIYLDYAATTPLHPEVAQKMSDYLHCPQSFGNPGSTTHALGQRASEILQSARAELAGVLGASPSEMIFTGSATESINIALQGVMGYQPPAKVVTFATEHKATLGAAKAAKRWGWDCEILPVQSDGLVDLELLQAKLAGGVKLLSVMWVNNETGVVQPVEQIVALCRQHGVTLHIDAVQALGKFPINLRQLGADLVSISAHKIGGPKGVGALYTRSRPPIRLEPLLAGGSQERMLRPGTEPVHQALALACAARLTVEAMQTEIPRVRALRDQLWNQLQVLADLKLNSDLQNGAHHLLNVSFLGVEGESLIYALPEIAVSSGSACNSASMDPSHVLSAMGRTREQAQSAVRFSFGRLTTTAEIDRVAEQVIAQVRRLRQLAES